MSHGLTQWVYVCAMIKFEATVQLALLTLCCGAPHSVHATAHNSASSACCVVLLVHTMALQAVVVCCACNPSPGHVCVDQEGSDKATRELFQPSQELVGLMLISHCIIALYLDY